MRKQAILFASILILFTSMISAYSYSFGPITSFFDVMGDNLWLAIICLFSFGLITVILKRTGFFGENEALAMFLAFLIALGITFAFYKNGIGFDIPTLFYNLGFSDTAINLIVFFGTLGLIVLLFFKFGTNSLLILGGFLVALVLTGIVSGEGMIFSIGIGLIIVWCIIKYIQHRKSKYMRTTHIRGNLGLRGFPKK